MPLFVNISGTWAEVSAPSINVNGVYYDLTEMYYKVNGAWMSIWEAVHVIWNKNTYLVLEGTTASDINKSTKSMRKGGSLLFGAGTWNIDEPIRINTSGISIIGAPNNMTTLKRSSNHDNNGLLDIRGTSTDPLKNIIIRGLVIDGQYKESKFTGKGIYAEHIVGEFNDNLGIKIEDCTILNNDICGVEFNHVYNNYVLGNVFQNNFGNNLSITNSRNINISKNIIQNSSGQGLSIDNSNHNIITDNTIQNNFGGIKFNLSSKNTIISNIIQNNNGDGLNMTYSNNNSAVSNVVQNNGNGDGVVLVYADNNSITSNTVQNNGTYGIQIFIGNNNAVVGNTISLNGVHGVAISRMSKNNVLNSNIITTNKIGQLLDSGETALLYGNI